MTGERCSACPGKFHVIPGDNISPVRVVCVGQNPGKSEEASAQRNELGLVFIGQAGIETNKHYLPLAGLTRGYDVALTNCVRCHTDNDRKPTSKEIAACSAHFMPAELERYNPDVVVLMGGPACSLVPSIRLDVHHGYPRRANLFGKDYWVFPTFHPAAGMHDGEMMTHLINDFSRLRIVLNGDYSTPVNRYPKPVYKDLTGDHEQLRHILESGALVSRYMARDTETIGQERRGSTLIDIPWCSTFTIIHGTGYMVRAVDRDGLRILAQHIKLFKGILHNALYDLPVEQSMGLIDIDYHDYDDTMQLAYHQSDLPQGLKALGWRLAGMEMDDYSDVVMPYSRVSVLEWLGEAFDIASSSPGVKTIIKKRKIPKTQKALEKLIAELDAYRPLVVNDGYYHYSINEPVDSTLTKKISHIYKHTEKPVPQDGTPYNPWKAWQEQVVEGLGEEVEYEVSSRLGKMPIASIEQVFRRDPARCVKYACDDSNATRCIHPILLDRANKYDGLVVESDLQ